MTSLAAQVANNTTAQKILSGPSTPEVAARDLNAMGIRTSERSVRRYRSTTEYGTHHAPVRTDSVPKDMPVFTEYEGPNGRAALFLPRANATEHDLLRQSGFDPDSWRIKGHVNTRKWMRYDQEWLFYYKFDVEQGESPESVQAHVEDLVKIIRRRSAYRPKFVGEVISGTYTIVVADWQIGKSEQGRGSADTVKRWEECLAEAVQDIVRLRKGGVVIDRLAILSTGDLVEGCGDHYDMQTFSVDLDRRSQNRVVREMLTKTILLLSPMFQWTTIAVIGGNHGENRRKGKAYTTFADNDDVAAPEAVKEAFDLAGWDHLEWYIPDEELSMCVDLNGVNVGLVHGHQFKGGANVLKKAEDWWRGNDFGLEAVRDAQILLSGHFHSYHASNITAGRTWIQAPTIDPGSKWYTDMSGNSSIPGVLTMVVTPEHPLGYDHLRVLTPRDTDQVS